MASFGQLLEQLKQASAAAATSTVDKPASFIVGGPASAFVDSRLKADQELCSEDRASTCSGSKSPESTQEFQPIKNVNDELVSRLILDNAKLARRVDEIETKFAKRIEKQTSDISDKLLQRIDELEKGVSVVIHDLLSLRRNVDAKQKETIQQEDAESKLQKLHDDVQGLVVDMSTCKNVLNTFFGSKQWTCTPAPHDASVHRAKQSTISANTLSDTNAPSDSSFRSQFAVQEIPGMSKTAPVTPAPCAVLSARPALNKSRLSSQQASPAHSQFSSKRASPVRSCFTDEQGRSGAVDRRASPVRYIEQQTQPPQAGLVRSDRLHDVRASPVPQIIPEESDSAHSEAKLLDQMIAESEKTLGKIKMIAESKGLSMAQSPGLEGRGSMTMPVSSIAHTNDRVVPPTRRIYSSMPTSPIAQRSRQVSATPTPKSPM